MGTFIIRNRIGNIEQYLIINQIFFSYLALNNKLKQLKYYKLFLYNCKIKATTSCRDISLIKKSYKYNIFILI